MALLGVLDPTVVDGGEGFDEAGLDEVQIFEREAAFLELAGNRRWNRLLVAVWQRPSIRASFLSRAIRIGFRR